MLVPFLGQSVIQDQIHIRAVQVTGRFSVMRAGLECMASKGRLLRTVYASPWTTERIEGRPEDGGDQSIIGREGRRRSLLRKVTTALRWYKLEDKPGRKLRK